MLGFFYVINEVYPGTKYEQTEAWHQPVK